MNILRDEVAKLLDKDNSGHGMNHVDRVTDLSKSLPKVKMLILKK